MLIFSLSLAVYYFTSVLVFSIEHVGPYASTKEEVAIGTLNDDTKERGFIRRPVDLFDRFRRLFGAYSIVKNTGSHEILWIINLSRMAVWRCPHCLGFWVAFVLAFFSMIWYQDAQSFFLNWWAAAGLNSVLVRFLSHES